jgi:hypothetical protein
MGTFPYMAIDLPDVPTPDAPTVRRRPHLDVPTAKDARDVVVPALDTLAAKSRRKARKAKRNAKKLALSVPTAADLHDIAQPGITSAAALSRRKARKAKRKAKKSPAGKAVRAFTDETVWRAHAVSDAAAGKRRRRLPLVLVALGAGAAAAAVVLRQRSAAAEPPPAPLPTQPGL